MLGFVKPRFRDKKCSLAVSFRDTRHSLQEDRVCAQNQVQPTSENEPFTTRRETLTESHFFDEKEPNSFFGITIAKRKRKLPLKTRDSIQRRSSSPSDSDSDTFIQDHTAFAEAFRENDAAKIVDFLDRDVQLTTVNGVVLNGYSAVLAYLVAPEREKLCKQLRLKGVKAYQSSSNKTSLQYKHGILFHTPLYTEIIQWKSSHLIQQIRHAYVPFTRPCKVTQHLLESDTYTRSSSHSFNHTPWNTFSNRFSRTRSNSTSEIETRSRSYDNQFSLPPLSLQCLSLSHLPISKKRKGLLFYVTLRFLPSGFTYKSPIVQGVSDPKWKDLDVDIPQHDDTLVITLMNGGLLVPNKVDSAVISLLEVWRQQEEQPSGMRFDISVLVDLADTDRSKTVQLYLNLGIQTLSPGNCDNNASMMEAVKDEDKAATRMDSLHSLHSVHSKYAHTLSLYDLLRHGVKSVHFIVFFLGAVFLMWRVWSY